MSYLLKTEKISKFFGNLRALEDVSISIEEKHVHGLIGPNGAGKTTLFNVITGYYQPTSGSIFLGDSNVSKSSSHQMTQNGVARTFQNIHLFQSMTALENVMVGRHFHSEATILGSILGSSKTKQAEKKTRQRSLELLEYVGIAHLSDQMASTLSYGDQRRLEIARALATEPKLLALDEPAAGMNAIETEQLRQLIQHLRDDHLTILIIEHDIQFIMTLCDHISVLDHGVKITSGTPEQVKKDPAVIEAYLGTE